MRPSVPNRVGDECGDLVALAGLCCATPFAVLHIVDEPPAWFAAGNDAEWLPAPLEWPGLAAATSSAATTIAEDTARDPRFAGHPLVSGAPHIRSLVAVPLVSETGDLLGALGVFDTVHRTVSRIPVESLLRVARSVVRQVQLRRRVEALTAGVPTPALADDASRERRRPAGSLVQTDALIDAKDLEEFPVWDGIEQISTIAGMALEVSELTDARQAHQEAEQRWRALVEHSSVGVAVLGRGGKFRYVNQQVAVLLGAGSRRSLIGRTVEEFVPDDADPAALSLHLDAVLNGAPPVTNGRAFLRTVGGARVSVEFSAAAIADRGERAVQVELRDVTATAAAEAKLRASESRFRAVFHNSPVAMGITDDNGRWVDTNAALERLLGVGTGELLGAVGRDFVHPADQPFIDAARGREPGAEGEQPGMEVRFIRRDGELRWAWISLTAAPGLGGQKWVLGISKDVTGRKAAETALRESQTDLAAIAAVAKCVQSGDDPRPLVVTSIRELSGASSVVLTEAHDDHTLVVTASAGNDVVGVRLPLQDQSMTAQVWRTGQRVFLADVAASSTVNRALLKMNTVASSLWQPVIIRGQVQAVIGVGWQHKIEDPGDRAIRVVQVIADEAGASLQAARLHRELERLATTDPLTGSLNRRAWDRALQRLTEIGQLTGEPLAIAMLDLDHFKTYNDRHGHMAGDSRLAEFAAAARSCLRKNDVFARWGGEEFVVALPDCSSENATRILERLRATAPAGLTCSVGHTSWIPGEDLAICIARADSALYIAKNAGRDQIITA